MSIVTKGGLSGNLADVDANNQLKVALASSATNAGFVKITDPTGDVANITNDGRLAISPSYLLHFDPIDGANLNTNYWQTSTSGQTITQSGGNITLNANSNLTANSYSILQSVKYFQTLIDFPLVHYTRAKMISNANGIMEWGFGSVATNTAPTDGVFFRMSAAGVLTGVINNGGSEALSTAFSALNPSNFYSFEITTFTDKVEFSVTDESTGTESLQNIPIPASSGVSSSTSRLPAFMRSYNNSVAPTVASQCVFTAWLVYQQDAMNQRPWALTKAEKGLGGYQSPVTGFSQTAQWANATNPSQITPNNTASTAYTTLGGQFNIVAPAAGTSDLGIFAFQIPAGFQFITSDIKISATNLGAAVATTPTVLQWAIAINSSAQSLATADGTNTRQPRRLPIGTTAFLVAAAVGTTVETALSLQTPLACDSGRWLHILVKPLAGTATGSQSIQGTVTIHGFWE